MDYKIYKIFDTEDFVLLTKGIRVAQCMKTDAANVIKDEDILSKLEDLAVSDKLFCSYCNASFDNQQQQRQHYKLDWHRYNLKKKLSDKKPVTEETFSRMADLDDVSSISGSESDTDDETDTDSVKTNRLQPLVPARHTKVFFENDNGKIFSVHRCLLHSKKDVPENDDQFVHLALKTSQRIKWTIVMLGGGHFAAGIFDGREVCVHKTFHCYTVRKGQGGTQSARDGRSGGSHPKSAGASLRRYNEAALIQHVQDIMVDWSEHLATCDLVFYRASGRNMATLFGGRSPPLLKTDPRLRTIPFPTRRATFKEVKRVQEVLASLEVYGSSDAFQDSFPQSPRKKQAELPEEVSPISPKLDPPATQTRSPRHDRAKARKSPERPLPSEVLELSLLSSDSELSSDPSDRFARDTEVDFLDSLQEFQVSMPRNARKKTTKKPRKKKPKPEPDGETRREILELRKKLKTACQLGNIQLLTQTVRCSRGNVTSESGGQAMPGSVTSESVGQAVCGSVTSESVGQAVCGSVTSESVGQAVCGSVTSESGDQANQADDPASVTTPVQEVKAVTEEDVLICLNESVDDKGNRLLHIAAENGRLEVLRLLLSSGADPGVKNRRGQPPYVSSVDKETRNTFRRFLADFPDKYDYTKTQIPGGLTDDLVKEQAEKKRALKKAKRDKVKEKKKEDQIKKEEEVEKERFLKLTDREKRALAAERRILSQAAHNGGGQVIVSRCFLCAVDISGKIPFEYDIHRFCSIECLKSHRMMKKT